MADRFFENSWPFIKSFFRADYYSTSIFFILSGFILTYVYLDSDGTNLRIKFSRFYLKRLFRLCPFHWLGFILILFPLITGASMHDINFWHSIYNLSLIHAWIPNTDILLSFNRISWSASALVFFLFDFSGINSSYGWVAKIHLCESCPFFVDAYLFGISGSGCFFS